MQIAHVSLAIQIVLYVVLLACSFALPVGFQMVG